MPRALTVADVTFLPFHKQSDKNLFRPKQRDSTQTAQIYPVRTKLIPKFTLDAVVRQVLTACF